MRCEPERTSTDAWIDPGAPPPVGFIAAAMDLAMMAATQWDRKLVADLAAECPALRETQVVGIRWLATTNQTRLLGHMFDVLAVPNPARL